jgi:hypothetical protein
MVSYTLQRHKKIETKITRKGTARPHSCFCERFICSLIGLPVLLQAGKQVDPRTWEYIDRSQTNECGNWD